ncbi:uncharacterized protein LOC119617538 [Kryptolebias marmoratus]|uniref:uncharacterized protein LOC119617538 n=1 Tax=Kryptolebias marmoratus TaxID=37003 RepID=UPI0018ACA263|nr:uncharacterized protein LOC119617538 [Kryptolebias marmoratus]
MTDPTLHPVRTLTELCAALEELENLLKDLDNRLSSVFHTSSVQRRSPVLLGRSQRVGRRTHLKGLHHSENTKNSDERRRLIKLAMENCLNQTVLEWLRETSESSSFMRLGEMFHFLKRHIDEEEKKNHSDTVDITFVCHGSLRDFMIPASCLLPLSSIRDVILYSPWNCVTSGLTYGIATGRMKPQHRVFYCTKKDGCELPDEKHRPMKLPDHWNSMKKAGDQMVPNISVSPLRPDDGVWKSFESLTMKYGPPGRNRIVIPFILPGAEAESFPFSVVTLALSLVLLQSRFKATVHLDACLGDRSVEQKLDRKYLEKQYGCTVNGTGLKCSLDMFRQTNTDHLVS